MISFDRGQIMLPDNNSWNSLGEWVLGTLSAVVTVLCGWNGTQQMQINAMRQRQEELRDLIASDIRDGLSTFREDTMERHRENIANIRVLQERIDRLGERLRSS